MGKVVQEFLDNWGAGVITTLPPDQIPPAASPRAWNSELTQAAGDRAIARKRKGIVALLANRLSAAAVLGQFYYRPKVSGAYTPIQLAYTADGCLWKISGTSGTCLSARLTQDLPPEFAQAKDLCFLVNGVDRLKVLSNGTTLQNFGIDRPAAAPTAVSGAAGSMTGTYDLAFTYYNSATGHESSRSDTITLAGLVSKKIDVTIPAYASTVVPTVTATGGTKTTLADGALLHAFTANANFVVSGGSLTVEYLLVAGGGGGGAATSDQAAGGGAGGQVLSGSVTLAAGTYAVTVGAAGAKGTVAGTATGGAGGNSTFNGLTARGGSGGGGSDTPSPSGYLTGGAGSGPSSGVGAATIYAGGNSGSNGAGGGAGAGGPGGNAPGFSVGGDSGPGVYSSITGAAVAYGGGGAGAGYDSPGVASYGGGTGATFLGPGGDATALRGAGGGGARFYADGGAGSAGIVYLRYTNAPPATKVPDEQVDTIRVHIRKQSTNAYLFRVNTGTGYNATTGGWAVGYGTLSLDLSDSQLQALTELTPDTSENDRPPAGVTHLCWHNSRMFAADDTTLYYSKVSQPEAFDADFYEPLNPEDGQEITALKSIGGVLIIFKTHSIWGLFGDDPNSWYLRNLDPQTGCSSARSVVTVEGKTYWWSEQGAWMWSEGEEPFPLGKELIQPTISPDNLNPAYFTEVVAAPDLVNNRIIFALPEAGETRNTILLPYSYRLNRWEASKWDPMDAASLVNFVDEDEYPFICLGNYAGELFRVSYGEIDGVSSGTVTGPWVPSATSTLTLTDAGATFQANLAERRVTVVDSDGVYVGRRKIVSNTSTGLVFDEPLTGLTVGATYTYYVGGPDWQFDTRWGTFDAPFHKKRFEYLFIEVDSAPTALLDLELRFDWNSAAGQLKRITPAGADTTWNADIWEAAAYGTASRFTRRLRVGRTGRAWSLRLRNPAPNSPITLHTLGVQAEVMTTNR